MRRRRTSDASDATSGSDEQLENVDGTGSTRSSSDAGSTPYVPSRVAPPQLLPLLQCRLCINASDLRSQHLFRSPMTLPCGHTICASHLQAGSSTSAIPSNQIAILPDGSSMFPCPIPECSSLRRNQDRVSHTVHAASSVALYMPLQPLLESLPAAAPDAPDPMRPDIKVTKLLDLVRVSTAETDPPESSHAPISPCSRRQDSHRRKRARPDPDSGSSIFVKQLREILTCEVCLVLYHEPMTLQCGHVRSSIVTLNSSFAYTPHRPFAPPVCRGHSI